MSKINRNLSVLIHIPWVFQMFFHDLRLAKLNAWFVFYCVHNRITEFSQYVSQNTFSKRVAWFRRTKEYINFTFTLFTLISRGTVYDRVYDYILIFDRNFPFSEAWENFFCVPFTVAEVVSIAKGTIVHMEWESRDMLPQDQQ